MIFFPVMTVVFFFWWWSVADVRCYLLLVRLLLLSRLFTTTVTRTEIKSWSFSLAILLPLNRLLISLSLIAFVLIIERRREIFPVVKLPLHIGTLATLTVVKLLLHPGTLAILLSLNRLLISFVTHCVYFYNIVYGVLIFVMYLSWRHCRRIMPRNTNSTTDAEGPRLSYAFAQRYNYNWFTMYSHCIVILYADILA